MLKVCILKYLANYVMDVLKKIESNKLSLLSKNKT
jgi:hypothetical protein